jgi:hypothetical protein
LSATMTPAAWLEVLLQQLDSEQPKVKLYKRYRDGDHDLRYATAKFRQAFGGMFNEFSDNWCELIVDAPNERLHVKGFRLGSTPLANKAAWAIWQANNLDTASTMVHREAITCSKAYWLVEPVRAGETYPRVTPEDPSCCTVITDPSDRRIRLAALKRWLGTDGYLYATVYLPDAVYKYRSTSKARQGATPQWSTRPGDPGGGNELGVVPMIPVINMPDMMGGGRSDLRNAIPLQNAITKTVLDMLVASEFAAFPQRVVLGAEAPKNPDGSNASDSDIKMAMSKLLMFKGDAKIDQYSAADLNNYVTALSPLVHHLAGQTRTPPHYLLGEMVNVSGDALVASESGLVARTSEKQTPFGEGHEEMIRVAGMAMGDDELATASTAETIWADAQFRNEAALIDGLVKLKQLNIPDEILWERLGMSPTEIERVKVLQAADEILGIGGQETPPPTMPPVSAAVAA